ncbi:MAG: 6-phosphofructokinase [Clostridia bacterium]|nr:6-phosphofructokinase [Clostridia bacterium]
MKRIAVFTSGGDAPGMNACIRSVVRFALSANLEVLGVLRGFKGLIENEFVNLSTKSVGNIVHLGGTMLYTSRCDEFLTEAGQKKAILNLKKHKIDGVVVIGGNGSFNGALVLENAGFKVACIPATIDNDLYYTDYSLGYDTAVNTVTNLVNNIRDTAQSHERPCVIEVMGAFCGDIALTVGASVGAEIILVPEIKIAEKQIVDAMQKCKEMGKNSCLIITNEKTYKATELTRILNKKAGVDARALEIGHIQRGGSPSALDRTLALKFGAKAIELLKNNKSGAVGQKNGEIFAYILKNAIECDKIFDVKTLKEALVCAGSVLSIE